MPVYLIYLSIFFVLPVLILGWITRKELIKYKKTILWCLVFVYAFGFIWDWLAVQTGVWKYDSAETIGIGLDGIPVEEFIGFYIFGTLFIAFVIVLVRRRLNRVWTNELYRLYPAILYSSIDPDVAQERILFDPAEKCKNHRITHKFCFLDMVVGVLYFFTE